MKKSKAEMLDYSTWLAFTDSERSSESLWHSMSTITQSYSIRLLEPLE